MFALLEQTFAFPAPTSAFLEPMRGFALISTAMCALVIGRASLAAPAWMLTLESLTEAAMQSLEPKATAALTLAGARSHLRTWHAFALT